MDTAELIHRWRKRRREILETLPPELRAEYRQLGRLLKALLNEQLRQLATDVLKGKEAHKGGLVPIPVFNEGIMEQLQQMKPFRVALSRRKEVLLEYLAKRGSATRSEILHETDIPPGSLSLLLQHPEFESVGHGMWRIRKASKK